MTNFYYYFLLKGLFEMNFFFYCFCLFLALIIYYFSKFTNFIKILKNFDSIFLIKTILLFSILISFFLVFCTFWLFVKFYQWNNFYSLFSNFLDKGLELMTFKLPLFNIVFVKFSIEFFGFIFIILAYIVGFISFLALDSRFYWNNLRFIFVCNFLVLVIYIFTIVNDLLLFFLLYEAMLIPSFLFVYYMSPYRRGIQASLYFLVWTQLGSLLVLSAVSYVMYIIGSSSFIVMQNFKFTLDEIWYIYFLLFFGFGFKVPIWPLQYWLTKTHVEAPAGFSIFLSGFLVKTAIYGFFKLTNMLGSEIDTYFFSIFTIMGVVDASIKMWGQLDLKKLVAYGTVQEMNLIYIAFLWGDVNLYIGGIMFCVTHAFLSALMFYLVDCIQRRFNTRIVSEISGILHLTPNLGISILLMQVFYSGLPGTLKFLSEFYIFSGLFSVCPFFVVIILIIANFLGLVGFSKCWFNVVFGLTLNSKSVGIVDLTFKESFIIGICYFSLILSCFMFNFIL